MEDSKNIRALEHLLEKEYGKKVLRPNNDPLSELVATILSQNTSDTNSHRAYKNLRHDFRAWGGVRSAPLRKIQKSIKIGGLEKIKAERIKDILDQIYRKKRRVSLAFLKKWDTERIRDYLGHFKGVGDKTIACVLLFALGRPVLPVDTHVLRVSKRLGLIPEKTDSKKAHLLLQNLIPPALAYPFHLNVIEHGRKICKARAPLCGECVLFRKCEFKDKYKYI